MLFGVITTEVSQLLCLDQFGYFDQRHVVWRYYDPRDVFHLPNPCYSKSFDQRHVVWRYYDIMAGTISPNKKASPFDQRHVVWRYYDIEQIDGIGIGHFL